MPLNTKKKSDDMQIDRLIQIVFLLLRHENITAKQLAEELCVSTRTIYRDIKKERNNITALERAIINKYVITFTYFNAELTVTHQTVEPLKLVFKSHSWYLVAYSENKKDIRIFKISRIRELQITSQLFDRELPKDFSITPVYKEEYNTPVFILHFSEKIAYKVYDEFQEKYIKKLDDGTLEVTFRYQLSDWTFLYLLSFGEYVEIIEPVEARNILKEKAKKIFSMY